MGLTSAAPSPSSTKNPWSYSRRSESTPTTVTADSNDGYDAGVGSVGGLVLILAAAGAAVAVRHSRKAKLSPA